MTAAILKAWSYLGWDRKRLLKRIFVSGSIVVPSVFALFAARSLLGNFESWLGWYDESALYVNAFLIDENKTPHRDFYTAYPPGTNHLFRFVWWVSEHDIWATRVAGLTTRVLSAVLAGMLANRIRSLRGMCVWTFAMVLLLQDMMGAMLYAYPLAVLIALAVLLSWPGSDTRAARYALSGALLGLLSFVRHDLFAYACAGLVAVEVACIARTRRTLFCQQRTQWLGFGAGLLASLLLLWVPLLLRAGVSPVLADLVLDQAFRVMPARRTPIPSLLAPIEVAALQLRLPWAIADRIGICLLAAAGGAASGLLLLLRVATRTAYGPGAALLGLCTVFAVATLPQALQRIDYWHVVSGVPLLLPVVVATFATTRFRRECLLLLVAIPMFASHAPFAGREALSHIWSQRDDTNFLSPEQRKLRGLLARETRPGEPVFVGCTSHRRVLANHMDLYYVGRRPGASRYMQFDPGIITEADRQREVISDLERSRPNLVLLFDDCAWDEPNASRNVGSPLLDNYLQARYTLAARDGSVQVWRPKSSPLVLRSP